MKELRDELERQAVLSSLKQMMISHDLCPLHQGNTSKCRTLSPQGRRLQFAPLCQAKNSPEALRRRTAQAEAEVERVRMESEAGQVPDTQNTSKHYRNT